jgi:filamentous hemagglutinin family protein
MNACQSSPTFQGRVLFWTVCVAVGLAACSPLANPVGGVVKQGTASFNTSGNQVTVTQTSPTAQIDWNSFNIGAAETTTFVQPSSSSVIWNQINDPNTSQILGSLNANGYVVLQNSAGFYIGGAATITAHGLILSTATSPPPDFTSGGPWQFNAPPPTASIVNYGQIRLPDGDKGGAVYLIAADIQNRGTITAPQSDVGLLAGQQVLVSLRPDGRGLTATVTLPQGSVDNEGRIIADAGTIALNAQTVNQGGLIEANSIRTANGVIELVASDSLSLKDGSTISATADATSTDPSPGGFVIACSGGTFTDTSSSSINVAGATVPGKTGGHDGLIEVFGTGVKAPAIQSQIDGASASSFLSSGGLLLINPQDITLSTSPSTPSAPSPNLNRNDLSSFSKIELVAARDITLNTTWNLADTSDPDGVLRLSAGNNVTLNSSARLAAGNNWSLDISAGPRGLSAQPASGTDGLYLNGASYIQAQNGGIDIWAANEVQVNRGFSQDNPAYGNGIRTLNGGAINVTAQFGDVVTGGNPYGFDFSLSTAPYYSVMPNLGGISTAAGGNVSITAGGNVISYNPLQAPGDLLTSCDAQYDGGSGAFGGGNVTVTAGKNVYGHFVLANGLGSITAGGNIGSENPSSGFALSLIKGSWSVSAPSGSIYIQDARNPNGVLNDGDPSSPGYHLFDYDPAASLSLNAGNMVEVTGSAGSPHTVSTGDFLPMIFPPSLSVTTGPGGFVLNNNVTLYPSAQGELQIVTTAGGNFQSYVDPTTQTTPNTFTLAMSDSAANRWLPPSEVSVAVFGMQDNAPTPPELNNPNPVQVQVSGNINNVTLRTTKQTEIAVGGNAFNFSFLGQNLSTRDVTSVNVAGSISYSPVYSFADLPNPISSPNPSFSTSWDAIFSLLVHNADVPVPPAEVGLTPAQLTAWAFSADSGVRLFLNGEVLKPGYDPAANPGFIYDPAAGTLGFRYQMPDAIYSALNKAEVPILQLDAQGHVILQQRGNQFYLATTTASFVPQSVFQNLFAESQSAVHNANSLPAGLQIGGPGQFNVKAGTLDLGSSTGIYSWGIGSGVGNPVGYGFLAPWTPSGAALNVDVAGNISLLTSTIASIFGGAINVTSGGEIDLSLGNFALIPSGGGTCYGIFTSGKSDVTVTAQNDINVGGARIAAFNGGNVLVESEQGNVDAGNGANSVLSVPVVRQDPASGAWISDTIDDPRPFGSGIIAVSPSQRFVPPGASDLPGNITVATPEGNITSTLGGIQQYAMNGSIAGGPTVTLTAGTPPSSGSAGHTGNIDLGEGGVVGGTVNVTAQGNVQGLIVSRQNANINAAQSFTGTVLSSGTANVNASGGSVSGTIIGISGVNASGSSGVSANIMSANVSIGGAAATSTLTSSGGATVTAQAAAQQTAADTRDEVAKATTGGDDDLNKRKLRPALTRRVGRVTVILPKS